MGACASFGRLASHPATNFLELLHRATGKRFGSAAMRHAHGIVLVGGFFSALYFGLAIFIFLFAAHLLSHAARARTHARIATPLQGGRPERPGLLPFLFLNYKAAGCEVVAGGGRWLDGLLLLLPAAFLSKEHHPFFLRSWGDVSRARRA